MPLSELTDDDVMPDDDGSLGGNPGMGLFPHAEATKQRNEVFGHEGAADDLPPSEEARNGKRTLRPYQQHGIDLLRASIGSGHRRPVLQLPTGGGKTRLAGEIIRSALHKGNRCVFTVPAISLVDQTYQSFWQDGITDIGIMQANHPMTRPHAKVQIASLETLKNRQLPDAKLIIVDEAHRRSEFLEKWMAMPEWKNVPFIGLSATPWAQGMANHWDDLIIVSTTREMIGEGYLSPFKVFATGHPDLSKIKIVNGDYQEKGLSEEFDKPTLVGDVVQTWIQRAKGLPTLVFAVDCAHAKHLQERFLDAGIPTAYVDAKTSREDRIDIGRGLKSGRYQVVCNIRTMTTGVDLDVRCIVLAMATKSEILFTQIIGRGLRTAENKETCIILDHGGTHLDLGMVTDIHHDSLDDGKGKTKKKSKKPGPKECPSCAFLMPPGTAICPNCGFVRHVKSDFDVAEGELVEITPGALRGKRSEGLNDHVWITDGYVHLAQFYGELLEYAHEKGYSPGWTSHKFKEAVGVWPNHWKSERKTVSVRVRNWIRSRQIAFAKGNSRGRAAE